MWPGDPEADASQLEAGSGSPVLMGYRECSTTVAAGAAVAVLEQAPSVAASRVSVSRGVPGAFCLSRRLSRLS